MQTADTKVLHVVIAIIKEFIYILHALFDQEGWGIDIADCLDSLLQDTFAEM